jgi:hypothetical protein
MTHGPDPAGSVDPLFLVGAPRSGTSLVYKALSLHPDAAFISNWVQKFPAVPQLAVLDRLPRRFTGIRRAAWFPDGNAYAYGRRRALLDRLVPAPAEGEPVFTRAGVSTSLVEQPPEPGAEAARLRSAFSNIARWNGGRVLVVKRIANNRRIPLLRTTFPDARFVEIVRDGRAVAHSISKVDWWPAMRVWWLGQTPVEWAAAGHHPLELCARHWVEEVDVLERHLADVTPDQRLTVRYEDLITDPHRMLAEVASFGGLDADDREWRRELEHMSVPDRNRGWADTLSWDDVTRLEDVQGNTLHRLGYGLASEGTDAR